MSPKAAVTRTWPVPANKGCVFSPFWLETEVMGVSWATLPLQALGKNAFMPLPASGGYQQSLASQAYGHITPVSALRAAWPSPVCCLRVAFLYRHLSLDLGLTESSDFTI